MKSTAILALSFLAFGTAAQEGTIPVAPMNKERIGANEMPPQQRATLPQSDVEQVLSEGFEPMPKIAVPPNFIDRVAKTWKPTQEFKLKPKDNILIAVGQGLMNTVSTNFGMLTAKTNDEFSSLEIDEGYLYVTVSTMEPISLILYEEGVLESQVSITLIPVAAPPTIARIDVEMTPKMKKDATEYQARLKTEDQMADMPDSIPKGTAYANRIVDLLTPVAQGDFPRGFGLTADIPDELRHPCQMTIFHRTEQRIVGGREIIDVVLVKNDSGRPYQVREEMCITSGTLAVALFEKSYLMPGDESEMYILRDKLAAEVKARKQRRPRLIGGN
jgi:conjugal transfer pilus assembly protein TraK